MKSIILAFVILISQSTFAQGDQNTDLFVELAKLDSLLFEEGFNKCQFAEMESLISEDFEFYHDQNGVMEDKEKFLEILKKGMCANWTRKPLRKLTKASVKVHPLYQNGLLYGAIQSGDHEFYIAELDKEPYLTSTAKFTHLWIKTKNGWVLKRVLSYDHREPKAGE